MGKDDTDRLKPKPFATDLEEVNRLFESRGCPTEEVEDDGDPE